MKPSTPDWLTPIVRLEDFKGDVIKYLDHVFSIFTTDFITATPIYNGKKVFFDKKDDGGKPAAFVHITTEENRTTKGRELCLRRCERIAWIKAIIEHANDPVVKVWEKEQQTSKRRAKRTYLFLDQEDFLVILQEIKHGHYMITAIYVDNPNQKRKHLRAHQVFQTKQGI
jgi:hypothetical protein